MLVLGAAWVFLANPASAQETTQDVRLEEARVLFETQQQPCTVRFNRNGDRVLTAAQDKTATIRSLVGEPQVDLEGHAAEIHDAVFSPDGHLAATAGNNGTIKVWDAASGVELWSMDLPGAVAWAVEFSADGAYLAAAAGERIMMWPTSYEKRGRVELDVFAACRVDHVLAHGRLKRVAIDHASCNRR